MPSWKLAPQPRSKHEKRTAGSAWETWTVAAAAVVRFARVRWEINFLLTTEIAQFFCVYSVQQICLECRVTNLAILYHMVQIFFYVSLSLTLQQTEGKLRLTGAYYQTFT